MGRVGRGCRRKRPAWLADCEPSVAVLGGLLLRGLSSRSREEVPSPVTLRCHWETGRQLENSSEEKRQMKMQNGKKTEKKFITH